MVLDRRHGLECRLNTKGQAVASRSKTGRGKVTAPIFLLVPQVKLPKRMGLEMMAFRLRADPGSTSDTD
jgi:hypothetical protein